MQAVPQSFYNEKAERAILALIMTDADARDYVPQFAADDFYQEPHKRLFKAMQGLYADGKPIDIVTLSGALRVAYGDAERALTDTAIDIATNHQFGAIFAAKEYAEIIKKAALRRRMYAVIDKAKRELLEDEQETGAVLDETRQALRDLVITGHAWKSMQDVMLDTFSALERRAEGKEPRMSSGISSLDACTAGFHKGEFTILGARPAVGKSALGAYIALSAAAQGYKIAICSREMTSEQYGTRIFANATQIDSGKLRTGSLSEGDWEQITDAMTSSAGLPISFMFSTRYVEDLRMEVQKKVDANELDMLIVDYVQLMQTKQRFDKDYMRIAYVSKMLKDMTTDYNIAIIGLAQVGRSSEGTMPTLAELRGSGDLEQDADNVMFLHRPEDQFDKYVNPADQALFAIAEQKGMQYVVINVAKQRQGQTGSTAVIFDPARMRFTAIERQAST